jgi:glycosyltransferase involved in cell wall biosynthesis
MSHKQVLSQVRKLLEKSDTQPIYRFVQHLFFYLVVPKPLLMELSIVIISKNDATGLERTLKNVASLNTEILVYDAGSTDGSREIAVENGAILYNGVWECYGHIRYKAALLACHDWILMLHTGEVVDEALKESLRNIDLTNAKQVYRIQFKNYFGNKWLRHGEKGRYSHIRLANRKGVETVGETVDESLFLQAGIEVKNSKGYIIHHAIKDCNAFAKKVMNDALLSAARYQRQGRKASFIKLLFSPIFSFIKNYFFKLGFLDGWEGFFCAGMSGWYNFLKYNRLRELNEAIKTPL